MNPSLKNVSHIGIEYIFNANYTYKQKFLRKKMSLFKFLDDFVKSRNLEEDIRQAIKKFSGDYYPIAQALQKARKFNKDKPSIFNYIPILKYLRQIDTLYEVGEF